MLSLGTDILLGLGLIANAQNFTNPVIYEDFPDNDIFLGPDGKPFYFSSSSFHYSPRRPDSAIHRPGELGAGRPFRSNAWFLDELLRGKQPDRL